MIASINGSPRVPARTNDCGAEPNRQPFLQRPRIDALAGQRRAVFSGPVHVLVLANRQEQVELFREEGIVIFELEPE
jgi:hypothetical protein